MTGFLTWGRFTAIMVALLSLIRMQAGATSLMNVPDEYLRRVWVTEDGLPSPLVRSILQSRDGYLWIATDETLSRFDGIRFTEFDRKDPQVKNDRWMAGLAEGKDGSIWASACNNGVIRFKEGRTYHYGTNNGLPSDYVLSACVDRKGDVWVGTLKGLAKFEDDKFIALTNQPGLLVEAVRCIMDDRHGNLWVGTAIGLSCRTNGNFVAYTTNNLLINQAIYSLHETHDGSIWIGTSKGLSQIKEGKFYHYDTDDGLAHGTVRAILEDRNGNIWVGSHAGLQLFKDDKFLPVKVKEALSFETGDSISDVIYDLLEDQEGNVWAGTSVGLARLKEQKFRTLTTEDGLGHNQVTCVLEDSTGAVWIGTFGGLSRIKDEELVTFTRDDGLPNSLVLSLFEDREGTLWIGTDGHGICVFQDGKFSQVYAAEDQRENVIRAICEDRENNLWIGSNLGVSRYENGEFVFQEALRMGSVKTVVTDNKGNLWVGARGGLTHWLDGHTKGYSLADGLSQVNGVYIDKEGVLWLGTELNGLMRFKEGKFQTFATADGPFKERVIHVMEDDQGNFWMSTKNGIFSAAKKELNDFADGRIFSVNFVSYGRADGLRRAQCNGIGQPAGLRSRDGRFWFPTLYGVVVFNPEEIAGNRIAPPVAIEQVLVDGKPFPQWRTGDFPAGDGHLEFQYTGLSFHVPEKVHFKYMLEGVDQGWQDASTRRAARYTNLRPGKYRFLVKACNNDGVWNETADSLSFSLAPHFYQQTSFYVLCGVVVISLGAGIWRLRVRSLKKREQELVVQVNARTKELQQEVTERKEAERRSVVFSKLGQSLSLAASQEQAAEVIADAGEELLGWDACSIYSYDSDEEKGKPIVVYNLISGKRINVLANYAELDLSEVTRKAIQQGAQLILRDEIRDKSGNKPACSLMFVPIRKGNKTVGVLSMQANKSKAYDQNSLNTLQALADYCGGAFERIRAESALRESQRVILRQERLAAVGQLSAGVAHEFNNILTIIKGHANLLLDNAHSSTDMRQSIGQIGSSAERAANLTRQMLAFSRKQIMQPKALDLNEVANQVTKMLSRLLGENISLCCNLTPIIPAVHADVGMMEQIIMNLALNARDAMPKGGRLIISTSATEVNDQQTNRHAEAYAGKFVCLTVADTGFGMDEATLQRIFEPFFTTKEVGKGTGLGLSTVYGIVKQHHGWIEVASKKGQGAAFTIFIPISTAAPHASQKLPVLPVNGGNETILFVEDEPDIRKLARQILERYGYRVLEAGCGVEALKVWEQNRDKVDLLLTDMVMPEGMTGRDLARQLQMQKAGLKVVFTSGYSVETLEKDFQLGQNEGAFRFLPKPYQPQKLAQIIRESLDSKN